MTHTSGVKLVVSRDADPSRCQALRLTELLRSYLVRQQLDQGIGVRPDGRVYNGMITAAVLLYGQRGLPQCTRKPVIRRNGYRVCRLHAKAKYFMPWTPAAGMTTVDASRRYERLLKRLLDDLDP